ncbi:MAG TPA: hypothetical protein VFJ57_11695 [Solirubrobacterales bacterium]|nr:hypothetical protein [Solirubrobacterales bacterium]
MEINFGQQYRRSQGEGSDQFIESLAQFCQHRLHGLVLWIELADGRTAEGVIDRVSADSGVTLERRDETVIGTFPADQILAFAFPPEPPIDHSDELRGI